MSARLSISEKAYEVMLDRVNQTLRHDMPGQAADLTFTQQDFWLQDTQVIDRVDPCRGQYQVSLLFVHIWNPLRWLLRTIRSYPSSVRANQAAHFMRRQAAKDQRGTLYVRESFIHLENN